ncbi:MAG: co-chaperone GroES [Clostridia bacterium]|nr:co-chaperone GroES [Clostridia bacterium]
MKIRPLGEMVVLKMIEAEKVTESGIVLPGSAQEKPQMAEVIAVGPGGMVDGKEVKMELKVGEKVIARKYAGTEIKLEGEEYIVLRQSDVLGIVE